MYCTNCGTKNEDSFRFCKECGKPLKVDMQYASQQNSFTAPIMLSMSPNKITFSGYSFDVTDSSGKIVYKAETMASGFFYKAHICDEAGNELLRIQQQAKATFVTLKFELYRGQQFIAHINQEIKGNRYVYDLPELGIFTEGDSYGIHLQITENGMAIATTSKKMTSFSDVYDITLNHPLRAEIVLAIIMVVQIVIGRSRRRR